MNPVTPAQPNTPTYPAQALELFPRLTRASYQTLYGVDAPTAIATRKPKFWIDPAAAKIDPNTPVTYWFVNTSTPGSPVAVQQTMLASEAATPNFPGVHTYPAWRPAPTNATIAGNPLNPLFLSNMQDTKLVDGTVVMGALSLAALWGAAPSDVTTDSLGANPQGDYSYPADETRRVYLIKGQNVGVALNMMYSQGGVGAPGFWTVNKDAQGNWISVQWTSTLPLSADLTGTPWGYPIRALLPDESLTSGIFGDVTVVRNDIPNPTATTAPASSDIATLTASIAAEQVQIAKLLKFFSIP